MSDDRTRGWSDPSERTGERPTERPTAAPPSQDDRTRAWRLTDDDDEPTRSSPPVTAQRRTLSDAPTRAQPRTMHEPPAAAATGGTPAVTVRRLRRGRLAIRKVDPWAVLKFSLVFYFCMLLILMLGTAVIFASLKAFGVVENIEEFLRGLEIDFSISGGTIFRWFFLIGVAGTVVMSAITVFMSFLYNLIADVVGGIELLVTERE